MQQMEEGVASPNTVDELKSAIQKFEHRAEDLIAAQEQTGIWYKMLASRYMDQAMYKEALDALEKAIEYYPANQNLFYYVGVCAGYLANAALDFRGNKNEREHYLNLSEQGYLRALELEPNYARALYGLSVLYTFEADKPEDAIPLLQKLLTIETKHFDGMFVLARAYYMTYNNEDALAVYDKIIAQTNVAETKAQAEENKRIVLDALYEQ